jgi:hypothetical protein
MVSKPGSRISKTLSIMGNCGTKKSARQPTINSSKKDLNKLNNKLDIGI